jgi:hypothetical protein
MFAIRTPLYYPDPDASSRVRRKRELPADEAVALEEAAPARDVEPDGYFAKLIKYVPVEMVTVFTALTAAASTVPEFAGSMAPRVIVFLFALASPVYFWLQSRSLDPVDRPARFFYVLTVPAFLIWALAINAGVRADLGRSPQLAEFLLATGAFAIPLIDQSLTALLLRKTESTTEEGEPLSVPGSLEVGVP